MRKLLVGLIMLFVITSCSAYRIPTNMTPDGRKSYIESNKKIIKENRKIKRFHNKERKRIIRIQSVRLN